VAHTTPHPSLRNPVTRPIIGRGIPDLDANEILSIPFDEAVTALRPLTRTSLRPPDYTGTILPFERKDGDLSLATPQIATDWWNAIQMGNAYSSRRVPYVDPDYIVTDKPGSRTMGDRAIEEVANIGLAAVLPGALLRGPAKVAAIHGTLNVPKRPVSQELLASAGKGTTPLAVVSAINKNKGIGTPLRFPKEQTEKRVAMMAKRKKGVGNPNNPRIVLKAPKGSGLPDFVVGQVTYDDWVKRTEGMFSKEEIEKAAQWYKEIQAMFLTHTGNDLETANKYMTAWLVAQQNTGPTAAMSNVLLQAEQIARNVPVEEMRAGGMPNPTAAARSVLIDQELKGGVGQKIADFVDSAQGRDVRAWMGGDPAGGAPFTIDIHSARDTGLVDQILINHLTRQGYDTKQLEKLKIDFSDAIGDTKYENRASYGRGLTAHLNEINWQGRSDWEPSEVQAVGWASTLKLTSGGLESSDEALSFNRRSIAFEADPGQESPLALKYSERFNALAPAAQADITQKITTRAMDIAQEVSGIDLRGLVHGIGGWEHYENPSAVGAALASPEGAEIAANVIGYLVQQDEVWVSSIKGATKNPKAFAVDFVEEGTKNLSTNEGLRALWKTITDADDTGLIKGYQPMVTETGEVGIRVLVDKGGKKTHEKLMKVVNGAIKEALDGIDYDVAADLSEASIVKAKNNWKENPDGLGFRERLLDISQGRPDSASDIDNYRHEFEALYEETIGAAEKGGISAEFSLTSGGKGTAPLALAKQRAIRH